MSPLRIYRGPLVRETVNSRPATKPLPRISFDVTPTYGVVSVSTTSGTYTWSDVFYHPVNALLTFTATLADDPFDFVIDEWFWDFGDGTTAVGQTVTHKYHNLNLNTTAHLRATDSENHVTYVSMNLMLKVVDPSIPTWILTDVSYNTWNDVKNAFATWNGVKNNIPGT